MKLIIISLVVGPGIIAYLLSQSAAITTPLVALIAIFILVLLRPLRLHFLPEMSFAPSAWLLKALGGGGIALFILVMGVIFLLAVTSSKSFF